MLDCCTLLSNVTNVIELSVLFMDDKFVLYYLLYLSAISAIYLFIWNIFYLRNGKEVL